MLIIVPMAGQGDRFIKKGYTDPKPFIKVNGKRIIEYILDAYDKENDEFIFIVNKDHASTTTMISELMELVSNCRIVTIDSHKKGPVFSVQAAFEFIKNDEEVIISYCDNPHVWNYADFKEFLKSERPDGCIISHSGFHPHSLNSTKMAFMKTKGDTVLEVKEKECYTDNHLEEHASTGTYYFKKGSLVKKYFEEQIEKDINYAGEYYVTLTYNLLIEDGLKVTYYDTPFVTVFGTPEEVESFEAWATILKSGQVKSSADLRGCYEYWKKYHN